MDKAYHAYSKRDQYIISTTLHIFRQNKFGISIKKTLSVLEGCLIIKLFMEHERATVEEVFAEILKVGNERLINEQTINGYKPIMLHTLRANKMLEEKTKK